ncbi:hypothetical protein [Halorubellus litoreus]|uniref:Transposase n=1 Tax=Halorubellus litoreus TaxID=755308 RepID=A0ABD5VPA0_9EURY
MTGSEHEAVHVHVHLVMAGAFPLRMADLLFTDSELVIPEYHYLTPLFGIARRETHRVAERAVERYADAGVDGLVGMAKRTHRIEYEDVERVRIYEGGAFGRPKVAVDVADGPAYAYRVHAPIDVPSFASAVNSLGERRGFRVDRRGALGFRPLESVLRFVADR